MSNKSYLREKKEPSLFLDCDCVRPLQNLLGLRPLLSGARGDLFVLIHYGKIDFCPKNCKEVSSVEKPQKCAEGPAGES